ncbi:M16 family metallopeptidase [Vulgatibacter sp.]|uniref:M16 family metallopeptidase n=1 Tax=Vulgatibacter sp. TaxID=1971226 RepID=UPI003567F404
MRHQLDNGLTVILHPNHAAPVVALQAWVQVGSADETEREAGLAHLHEHMLFKGTAKRGPGEVARDIEARGGEVNAWTSFDQTVYHLTIASRFFEQGLDVLADQVLHSVFDAGELSREIEVVLEEIKRANDMPSRRASREMFTLAYGAHPYRRPVIGYPETVRSFERDDVLSFYRRYYTPDNICLVIAGDFDEGKALRQIESLWGSTKATVGQRPGRAAEAPQEAMRAKVTKEPLQETHLALAFPIPDVHHDDLAALDLAAALLGHGDSARLVMEVKRERRLVNEVYAYAYTPKDPGLFVVGGMLRHEQVEPATAEILRQVYRMRREPVGAHELEVAKRLLESESIWQRETVQGTARKLGFYETVTGSLDFEKRYYERIRQATAEEIRAACDRYLRSERLNAVVLTGSEGPASEEMLRKVADEAEAAVQGQQPAAAAEAPRQQEAPQPGRRASTVQRRKLGAGIVQAQLPSGARVLVKQEPAVPIVAVRAAYLGGLRYEDAAVNGIHHLLARSLTKGTKRRSARELAALSDELVCSLAGNSGRNSFGLRGDFLARNFDASFRLFAECLREPAFDPKEVERERALQLEEIRARDDNPSGVAFDLFSQTLYETHPYRLDPIGELDVVQRLGPDDLQRWYGTHYGADNLVLTLVGDVDPDHAFALAEELFGEKGAASHPPPQVAPEAPIEAPRRAERHMEKQQAHLILGFAGARFADPDRHALELLASVLAGQGGRLFVELRDKRSMAYSVTAFNLEGIDPGYFAVYMGTSPEKLDDAVAGIRAELDKVVQQPITEEELQRARRYLVGSHAIGLQKNAARAAVIALDETYGMGAENFTRYQERIESVTREQILAAARRHLVMDRSVLAMVTPARST